MKALSMADCCRSRNYMRVENHEMSMVEIHHIIKQLVISFDICILTLIFKFIEIKSLQSYKV